MYPELSGCITALTVCNIEVANFCAAMGALIDQDGMIVADYFLKLVIYLFIYLLFILFIYLFIYYQF